MESNSMSLDFWPGTEIRRSTHNGFTTGLSGDWSDLEAMSRARERSAALAERRRASGVENSTIYGLSRKADKAHRRAPASMPARPIERNTQGTRGPNAGVGMLEDSKTGRIRAALESGPKTSAYLAELVGVDVQRAISLMRNDVRQGRIVKIGTVRPLLYGLPEAA
jgi:hypothetical protein